MFARTLSDPGEVSRSNYSSSTNRSYSPHHRPATPTHPYHIYSSPVMLSTISPHSTSTASPIMSWKPSFAQGLSLNIPTDSGKISTPKPLAADGSRTPTSAHMYNKHNDPSHVSDGVYSTSPLIAVSVRRGSRRTMQDAFTCLPALDDNTAHALFAICDGHGKQGAHVAHTVVSLLPTCFANASNGVYPAVPSSILVGSFDQIDKHIIQQHDQADNSNGSPHQPEQTGGSTCTAVYLRDQHLWVAHVGDSRAVLARAGQAIDLTTDHKPNVQAERERIEAAGGQVVYDRGWRVESLNVSRSFGDVKQKQYVTAAPDTSTHPVTSDDHILIVATDGLWSVLSSQAAVDICSQMHRNGATSADCSEALIRAAEGQHTADNIAVLVCFLYQQAQSMPTITQRAFDSLERFHLSDAAPEFAAPRPDDMNQAVQQQLQQLHTTPAVPSIRRRSAANLTALECTAPTTISSPNAVSHTAPPRVSLPGASGVTHQRPPLYVRAGSSPKLTAVRCRSDSPMEDDADDSNQPRVSFQPLASMRVDDMSSDDDCVLAQSHSDDAQMAEGSMDHIPLPRPLGSTSASAPHTRTQSFSSSLSVPSNATSYSSTTYPSIASTPSATPTPERSSTVIRTPRSSSRVSIYTPRNSDKAALNASIKHQRALSFGQQSAMN